MLLVLVVVAMLAISKLSAASEHAGFGCVNVAFGIREAAATEFDATSTLSDAEAQQNAEAAELRSFQMRVYVVIAFMLAATALLFNGPVASFTLNRQFLVSRVQKRIADEPNNRSQELVQKRPRIYRALTENLLRSGNATVLVREVMSQRVSHVPPSYEADKIQDAMKSRGFPSSDGLQWHRSPRGCDQRPRPAKSKCADRSRPPRIARERIREGYRPIVARTGCGTRD